MRLRATRLSATGANFRRIGAVLTSAINRAAALIRAAGRQSVIPALPIMDGRGHWWLNRNRTIPFDPTVDLEKPIEWIDDLTGNPVGWDLGPELVVNGTFDSGTTSWMASGATIAVIFGELEITRNGSGQFAYQQIATTPGATCRVAVRARNGTTFGSVFAGTSLGGTQLLSSQSLSSTDARVFTASFVAASTTTFIQFSLAALGTSYIDNISVREVIRDESWLGAELVTNGTFLSGITGWTETLGGSPVGTLAHASQELQITAGVNGVRATTSIATVANRSYRITLSRTSGTSPSSGYRVGTDATGGPTGQIAAETTIAGAWTRDFVFVATATTTYVSVLVSGSQGTTSSFDNISVKEVPGNHLVSPSAGTGPRATARVNLLQRTEDFVNAAWNKATATVTANAGTDPLGGNTATELVSNSAVLRQVPTLVAGSHTATVRAKKVAGYSDWAMLQLSESAVARKWWFNLSTGAIGSKSGAGVHSITPLGNGWYELRVTFTASAGSCLFDFQSVTADGGGVTDRCLIWGTDLRLTIHTGPAYPVYQRVGDGSVGVFDYDHVGFPVRRRNDGTRAMMTLGTVNMTGTSQAALLSVVEKLSSASQAYIAEFGASGSVAGGISLYADTSTLGNYGGRHRGSLDAALTTTNGSYPAPSIDAVMVNGNIATDSLVLSIDGLETPSGVDQGTGTMGDLRLNDMGRDVGGTPSIRHVGCSTPPALLDMSVIDLALAQEVLREYATSVGHTY